MVSVLEYLIIRAQGIGQSEFVTKLFSISSVMSSSNVL